jgi:glutathione synthase/RimK-type ligase-like ATP-grasp enzyme
MKTIAFFVRNIAADKYPFSVREIYYRAYQEYLLAIKQAGARAYFVTGNDSYLGDGRFAQAWDIDKVSEVRDFRPVGEVTADLVFNKGGFEGSGVAIVTDPRLDPIINDKVAVYARFGKYQPKSVVCANFAEIERALGDMPGEMVVVKNPLSSGGRQVYIAKKTELVIPEDETYPLLVQEFVDMSEGVPGLAKGVHDVRVLMTGPKIIGATLRQPQPGKLHANVSLGGSERFLSVDEIPAEVRGMAAAIDSELPDVPRYYAIDFARGKQGWRLIELNVRPGLNHRDNVGPLADEIRQGVAEYLVGLA